jgi:hypothetical protein
VNKLDSVYSVYLRQTTSDPDTNILIFSDNNQISNPKIAFVNNTNNSSLRIVWQSFVNNHWQILSRIYHADTLTNIVGITDSLTNNITPALSGAVVAWIQEGKLIYRYLDSTQTVNYLLDSTDCSNPSMSKPLYGYPTIVYEKGLEGNKQIIEAYYSYNPAPNTQWSIINISNGGNNLNPRINSNYSQPSFETFKDYTWHAVYSLMGEESTKNVLFNCRNPITYIFAILTKISYTPTPFFVVYDSDSLKNNREIIIKTAFYTDTTMNLSNAEGDDYLPNISFFGFQDTSYIAIYWTHDQNGKKDIWMAYTKYSPSYGAIENPNKITNYFILKQNYPNPFNPSTVISWHLPKSSPVSLKIYDILGNEITTLINEYQNAGEHSMTFNVQQIKYHILSSGVYFYQLKAGSNILTKKMLYLK